MYSYNCNFNFLFSGDSYEVMIHWWIRFSDLETLYNCILPNEIWSLHVISLEPTMCSDEIWSLHVQSTVAVIFRALHVLISLQSDWLRARVVWCRTASLLKTLAICRGHATSIESYSEICSVSRYPLVIVSETSSESRCQSCCCCNFGAQASLKLTKKYDCKFRTQCKFQQRCQSHLPV